MGSEQLQNATQAVELWVAVFTIGSIVLGLVVSTITLVWRVASITGSFKNQIHTNRNDINRLGSSIRVRIAKKDEELIAKQEIVEAKFRMTQAQLDEIKQHLNEKTGFYPTSLNTFEAKLNYLERNVD